MMNTFDTSHFTQLDDASLEQIEGGLFPIVIGGVVITAKAAAAMGLFAGGVGLGIYCATR